MNPKTLVLRAIERQPDLTYFGVGTYDGRDFDHLRSVLLSHVGLLEVLICAQWLRDATGERNSYGLKHDVENEFGVYIANGSLIAAALGMGIEYRVEGPNVVLTLGDE